MTISSLNNFDILVITIIFFSTLFAFFKGFIRTILSFVSFIGSMLITFYFYNYSKPLLAPYISNEIILSIFSIFATYLFCILLFAVINHQIINLTDSFNKGAIDRSLGFAFGFLRGCIFTCLIFLCIKFVYPVFYTKSEGEQEKLPQWVKTAQTYKLLSLGSDALVESLPNQTLANIENILNEYTKKAEKKATIKTDINDLDTISQMISALPESKLDNNKFDDLQNVHKEEGLFDNKIQGSLKFLLELYKEALSEGLIKPNQYISEDKINSLESRVKINNNQTGEN